MNSETHEAISIVMAGHVDHGKSTVIGRLLADMGALPKGKLEQVRAMCRRNARPFEYAFLLDALKDEQAQGITIDAARCFFKTGKRRCILIDAPGHIEFLKNMITGASRAEAALLVIDAREGIQENSKRHGYMLSMLGLRQLSVLVNKMDLVDYSAVCFENIQKEYRDFLKRAGIEPVSFIPVSGMSGANIVERSDRTPWYDGPTVREQIDAFERHVFPEMLPFRMPVQDIYKFTEQGDDRRIVAGTIETGTLATGDAVVFMPSRKTARVRSIEYFNGPPRQSAAAGEAPGITIEPQMYVRPGEWVTKAGDPPMQVATRLRVNLFWMGRSPMIRNQVYKLKFGALRTPVKLVEVLTGIDATDLNTVSDKQQVDRHDVAEVVIETPKPIAFDPIDAMEQTGRLVIVDEYEIAGAGIVLSAAPTHASTLEEHIRARECAWERGSVTPRDRAALYGHRSKFVLLTGSNRAALDTLAAATEQSLFRAGFKTYCLRPANVLRGLDADLRTRNETDGEYVRRLGELARILTDSGQIFITSLPEADEYDVRTLELLNRPHEILVVRLGATDEESIPAHVTLPAGTPTPIGVEAVQALLREKNVIQDYQI